MESKFETAVFGGGCFWCTEALFKKLRGVISVESGYAGGNVPNPTYEEVSEGVTGHAEVIKIEFDPTIISYKDLLTVFFYTHDPTTLNRQGADVGTQYRSVIYYTSQDQAGEARDAINDLIENKAYAEPIVTEVKELNSFYPAEEHHQSYYENNTGTPYCSLVIAPKLEKFQKRFSELLKREQ